MIKGGNTTIYVTDMDRAVTFYTEALGLTVLYRAGNHYCLVDAGDGLKLGLHPSSEHSPNQE
jgi:catechol 2,3-dioxygenase-like lactoylglutathione lyase family enzyme